MVAMKLGIVNEDGSPNRSRLVRRALDEFLERHPIPLIEEPLVPPPPNTGLGAKVVPLDKKSPAPTASIVLTQWKRGGAEAEKAGFEPAVQFPVHWFSKPAP